MSGTREIIFAICAVLAGVGSVYHAVGAFGLFAGDTSSPARHAVFVVIDAIIVWYLIKRPLWMLPAYVALLVQQTISHGGLALRLWRDQRHVDLLSVVLLLALYLGFVFVGLEAIERRRGAKPEPGA